MDYGLFLIIMLIGIALVFVQGACAYYDEFLTQTQMRQQGIHNGWSLMEHGGMWADVFIVSPVVAYIASNYDLDWSWRGLAFLGACSVAVLILVHVYEKGGLVNPEAHTHDGKTTAAGWIHAIYAVLALWVLGEFFLGLIPFPAKTDLLVMAVVLTAFFYLGVMKFSPRWKLTGDVQKQLNIQTVAIWAIAVYRVF